MEGHGTTDAVCVGSSPTGSAMKTKQEVQNKCFGYVFTLKEFETEIENNFINSYDGIGYFHDGENEIDISVWNKSLTWEDVKDFPYICWYNK